MLISILDLKKEAKQLVENKKSEDFKIKHCRALEIVAKSHGYNSYNHFLSCHVTNR